MSMEKRFEVAVVPGAVEEFRVIDTEPDQDPISYSVVEWVASAYSEEWAKRIARVLNVWAMLNNP